MVMYNVTYEYCHLIGEVTVIAKSITHALDLVDTLYEGNPLYQGVVDCKFVQRINTLLIEEI